jgi:hypothetical protein
MSAACWLDTTTVSSFTALVPSYGDRHLGLAVGPQVGQPARLAHLGEAPRQAVRQRDRQRQQLGGVVVRVAEHQALVTRTLAGDLVVGQLDAALVGGVHALRDVRRLRADRDVDPAGVAVEALGRGVVADLEDLLPHQGGDVDVRAGGDLARDVHLARGDQRLHRDAAARSLASSASRTESLMASHILSG